MKCFVFIFSSIIFFSCTKKTEPDAPDPAAANMVNVLVAGKTYAAPISNQQFSYTGGADLYIKAVSAELEVTVSAKATIHHYGAGNYFLYCCENSVLEKFAGAQFYKGVNDGMVNSFASQKGRLTVANSDSKGYSGTFSIEGKNAMGQTKSFAGSFKVVF